MPKEKKLYVCPYEPEKCKDAHTCSVIHKDLSTQDFIKEELDELELEHPGADFMYNCGNFYRLCKTCNEYKITNYKYVNCFGCNKKADKKEGNKKVEQPIEEAKEELKALKDLYPRDEFIIGKHNVVYKKCKICSKFVINVHSFNQCYYCYNKRKSDAKLDLHKSYMFVDGNTN